MAIVLETTCVLISLLLLYSVWMAPMQSREFAKLCGQKDTWPIVLKRYHIALLSFVMWGFSFLVVASILVSLFGWISQSHLPMIAKQLERGSLAVIYHEQYFKALFLSGLLILCGVSVVSAVIGCISNCLRADVNASRKIAVSIAMLTLVMVSAYAFPKVFNDATDAWQALELNRSDAYRLRIISAASLCLVLISAACATYWSISRAVRMRR